MNFLTALQWAASSSEKIVEAGREECLMALEFDVRVMEKLS